VLTAIANNGKFNIDVATQLFDSFEGISKPPKADQWRRDWQSKVS